MFTHGFKFRNVMMKVQGSRIQPLMWVVVPPGDSTDCMWQTGLVTSGGRRRSSLNIPDEVVL